MLTQISPQNATEKSNDTRNEKTEGKSSESPLKDLAAFEILAEESETKPPMIAIKV